MLLLYTKDYFQEGLAVAGNTLHRVLLPAGLRALRPFLMQHKWHLMPETFSIDPTRCSICHKGSFGHDQYVRPP